MTWAIAELLAKHAGRVTVSNPMRTRAIASAKVNTSRRKWSVCTQIGARKRDPRAPAGELPPPLRRDARRRNLD